jgi:hypothetical protein
MIGATRALIARTNAFTFFEDFEARPPVEELDPFQVVIYATTVQPPLAAVQTWLAAPHNGPTLFISGWNATAGPAPYLAESRLASHEARQQAEAIVSSQDLRNGLNALIAEEGFSAYDLQVATGVARSNIATWRNRPVEKLREGSRRRLSRLFYAWKFWLRVGDGQPLGPYLRTGNQRGETLLDLLRDDRAEGTDSLDRFITELAVEAKHTHAARLSRRKYLSGLPGTATGAAEYA